MKTRLLLFIGVLLSLLPLSAQIPTLPRLLDKSESLDQVKYRVLYRLDFISDVEDRDFVTQDLIRLDIGSRISKEYSQKLFVADSLAKQALEQGKVARWVNEVVPPVILYKGFPQPEDITVDYRLPSKAPVMTYTETKPIFDWQIHQDKKEVLGYNCQKATTSWAGRQWTAWFALEVPIPEGPYKFGGLPGLILEISDADKDYAYTCVGITDQLDDKSLVRWLWEQRTVSKRELDKVVRQLYANPEQALKALGAATRFAGDPMLDLPYNPIERVL